MWYADEREGEIDEGKANCLPWEMPLREQEEKPGW